VRNHFENVFTHEKSCQVTSVIKSYFGGIVQNCAISVARAHRLMLFFIHFHTRLSSGQGRGVSSR